MLCKAKNVYCLTLCRQCLLISSLDNAFAFPPVMVNNLPRRLKTLLSEVHLYGPLYRVPAVKFRICSFLPLPRRMLVTFWSGLSVARFLSSQDEPRGRTYCQETSRRELRGQDPSCWYPPWAAPVGKCLANAWPQADRGGAREQTPKSDKEKVFSLKEKHM